MILKSRRISMELLLFYIAISRESCCWVRISGKRRLNIDHWPKSPSFGLSAVSGGAWLTRINGFHKIVKVDNRKNAQGGKGGYLFRRFTKQ